MPLNSLEPFPLCSIPTFREREVRYQLENSGAVLLITDGTHIDGINLGRLPNLRRVYTTRHPAPSSEPSSEPFANLLKPATAIYPQPDQSSEQTLAILPYSSGTTGLPKGVMLSHYNLVANVYQFLGPNATPLNPADTILCCLPLYHIYGLNVVLNPSLILGAKLVLVPRFQCRRRSPDSDRRRCDHDASGPTRHERSLPSGRSRRVSP